MTLIVGINAVIVVGNVLDAPPTTGTTTTLALATTTSVTTTTTTTLLEGFSPVTNPLIQVTLEEELAEIPGLIELTCNQIEELPGDKFLDRITQDCVITAQARLDLESVVPVNEMLVLPEFTLDRFYDDVLHMLYVNSFESAGDPLLNGVNWGCPSQPNLKVLHPDPDGIHETGYANCPWFQQRVPIGYHSNMGHLIEGRSMRIFDDLLNPYDLYESSLLSFGLVYERGGNGWYHWWHIHWGLNRYLRTYGIRPVWFCPPNAYWQNVKGGQQTCPVP